MEIQDDEFTFEGLESKKLFAADLVGTATTAEVAIVESDDGPDIIDPDAGVQAWVARKVEGHRGPCF